jgi:hypothetical protein
MLTNSHVYFFKAFKFVIFQLINEISFQTAINISSFINNLIGFKTLLSILFATNLLVPALRNFSLILIKRFYKFLMDRLIQYLYQC